MKRGLLIIDRGSREQEAKDELEIICDGVRKDGRYDYVGYCFLEVVEPYIADGMAKALSEDLDVLTIVPYFLYPGKKVKAAVSDAMKMQSTTKTKLLVTRPMSMHPTMVKLVDNRITDALKKAGISKSKADTDVLIVCHGSKDPNAKMSIQYVMEKMGAYRSARYCFLEIEQPDIRTGISACKKDRPGILVIVFYFLHKGAHVKRDIYEDLNPALKEAGLEGALITEHIGADPMIVELIKERAGEVEDAK